MKEEVRRCAVGFALAALGAGCSAKLAPERAKTADEARPRDCVPTSAPKRLREGEPQEVVLSRGFMFASGPLRLVIDPTDGGRVVEFSLGGKNVLRARSESESYGSSFWTSPQSDWGWPPPFELDSGVWRWRLDEGGMELVLESEVAAKLALKVTQRVSMDTSRGAARFSYTIENRGTLPRKVAPWQNTRVAPGGLTLYPSGGPLLPESTLSFDTSGEVAFFQHDPARFTTGVKSFGDGKEGWLSHVTDDLVLIKVFPDVPPEQQAPKEAEIEIFVDGAGKFVEVEQQGPYVELQPGESSEWLVTWYLRRLPENIVAEPGSAALVEFIRRTIRSPG
jgi:hypothetical protein